MKTIIKTISCILILAVSAGAANYTVKSGGGGNFSTIQACAAAMSAGDTCTVYAGTYNENVSVPAGTAGNYKSLTINTGDAVTIQGGVTLSSHSKVNGFHIQRPSSPTSACISVTGSSTDFYMTNNVMTQCSGIREPSGSNSTHGFIQGNSLSYSCSSAGSPNVCTGFIINGDYHLIENNDISHTSDAMYLNGSFLVVRNNNAHDHNTSDCGGNSSNCHIDFMQVDTSGGTPGENIQHVLIENNTVANWTGSNTHAIGLFQGETCGTCNNAIVRFHKVSHVQGGGLFNDTATWTNVKTYNNTYADINSSLNSAGELTNTFTCCANGSDLNDIFYFTALLTDFNAYGCQSTGCTGFNFGHNLGFCTVSQTCNLRGHTYGSGSWTSDIGNLLADPLFNNYSQGDYSLSSSSPARNAGTNLTIVNGAISSSTSLVVKDATYFQDGWTIPGVQGDCIAVTTINNHVCITAVNYATNTLTLSSPISAANGDPVWIYSISDGTVVLTDSTGPDLGAVPYASSSSSGPTAPTGLAAIVN
jgi:hypothetical protein